MGPRYIVKVRPSQNGLVQFRRPPQPASGKFRWIPTNFTAEYKLRKTGPTNEDLMPIYRQYRHDYHDPISDSEESNTSLIQPISDEMPYHVGYGQRLRNKLHAHMPPRQSFDTNDDGTGKLVTFFRNGDSNYKGFTTSISFKKFATFETLLVWLNEKIPTTAGVRHVFALPEGYEVNDVGDFVNGHSYVVSGLKRLNMSVVYGYSKENYWHNRQMSGGKNRRYDRRLIRYREDSDGNSSLEPFSNNPISSTQPGIVIGASPIQNRPRVFTLISNSHRGSREKVILNPNTTQTFEEILHDCTNIIKMSQPPVQALYTAKHPFRRVQSITQILRDFKNHDAFIACGRELKPFEMKQKDGGDRSRDRGDQSDRSHSPAPSSQDPDNRTHENGPTNRDDYSGSHQPRSHSHSHSHSNRHNSDHQRNGENGNASGEDNTRSNGHQEMNQLALIPVDEKESSRSYGTKNYMSPRSDLKGMGVPALTPLPRIGGGIDTRRYRGDSYNQPGAGKKNLSNKDGGREDRVNVVRVDIHGKRREFVAPFEQHINDDGGPPDRSLQVDWVYGYKGKEAHSTPQILRTGEIVYFVSNFAVIYDRHRDKQRHYVEHNEDILCMNVHSRLGFVATGQNAGAKGSNRLAHVRVWDYRSLTTYMVLGEGAFTKGVCAVSFSHDSGIYLLAVDLSNKHVMTVWDWENDQILAKTTTSADTVLGASFHPLDESVLVTHGKQHISFWKIFWDSVDNVTGQQQGRILRDKKSGVIEGDIPQFITSLVFANNGDVITGDSNGQITVWSRDHNDAFIVNNDYIGGDLKIAHSRSVLCLCMMPDGTLISGGGNQIRAWDTDFRLMKERTIPDICGNVRSIITQSYEGNDGSLYVGTTNNMILEGSLQEKFTNIIQGHHDELWGLITHPKEHAFFTSSHDCHVIKWSATHHHIMWKAHVEKPCLAVNIDNKCSILAVGTAGGRLIILDANTGMHMCSLQVSADNLGCVTFSPDGEKVAVGSHDNGLYIYSVLDGGQCLRRHQSGVLTGHRNFITHIDWSRDGNYIQSVSGDYDLRYWNVDSMQKERSSNLFCDMQWATQTCIIGHPVLGAWSNLGKGEDINAVGRSNQSDLMVVGENKGFIRVYKYPCSTHKAESLSVKPYSSHVTNVGFIFDDSFLVSTGGSDSSIVQWSLVEPRANQQGETAS